MAQGLDLRVSRSGSEGYLQGVFIREYIGDYNTGC